MAFRGSLKQCLKMMHYQFRLKNHTHLSIVECPGGKYYTLLADEELLSSTHEFPEQFRHLLCRLTSRQLHAFAQAEQLSLDWSPPDNGNPKAV